MRYEGHCSCSLMFLLSSWDGLGQQQSFCCRDSFRPSNLPHHKIMHESFTAWILFMNPSMNVQHLPQKALAPTTVTHPSDSRPRGRRRSATASPGRGRRREPKLLRPTVGPLEKCHPLRWTRRDGPAGVRLEPMEWSGPQECDVESRKI